MPYQQKLIVKSFGEDTIIKQGDSKTFCFSGEDLTKDASHCLFFTCENRVYTGTKTEPLGDKLYLLIDDVLDAENAVHDRYALDLSCEEKQDFLRLATIKLPWSVYRFGHTVQKPDIVSWKFGIRAKAENVSVAPGGFLRLRLDRWAIHEGTDPLFTAAPPDETVFVDIPEGSYDYKSFETDLMLSDKDTGAVIVTVEGLRYSGSIFLEEPFLKNPAAGTEGNLLPPFEQAISALSDYAWLGLNLSKKEWPRFRIALNGKVFFEDEVFLRVHRYPPIEIPIPDGLMVSGQNMLSIQYISDYHDTVPVSIGEISLLERPSAAFRVIHCPSLCTEGKPLCLLAETAEDNISVTLQSQDFAAETPLHFPKRGLQVVKLMPKKQENNLSFSLMHNEETEDFIVPRFVFRGEDNVVCGTGDFVYTDASDLEAVKRFLAWYVATEAGNLLTIRPVYRWGGQRTVNPGVWETVTRIMRDLGFSYVHMTDGRDLPGIAQNPSHAMLEGEGYLGCQIHERDGQFLYWNSPREVVPTASVFGDLELRLARDYPDTIEKHLRLFNMTMKNGEVFYRRDAIAKADMKVAHDTVISQLRDLTDDKNPRHTGPTVLFNAFFEAGFTWAGAETMYGAMEPQLAFLRGASKAYDKKTFGVHHAVQWGTWPHNSEKKYRRYLLALLLSYMHGVTDINTEEGLWFMEARFSFYNRLSDTCKSYQDMERRLYRYIKTHTRRGKFTTKTAFLHGRLDGWQGMYSSNLWGDPNMPCGDMGASWQLLRIFYPLCQITERGMYRAGYITDDTDAPWGFYSGTPHGNVDAIPIENSDFSDYSLLCFAGYNAADTADFDKLSAFLEGGGTLVCGWPHLSTATDYDDIINSRHKILEHPLTAKLSDGAPIFVKDTLSGQEIEICRNLPQNITVLKATDSGAPLVCQLSIGEGALYLVNCLAYPGNTVVFPVYEQLIRDAVAKAEETEDYRILCGEDVGYTTFVEEDTHFFYLTPVDWYRDTEENRNASLVIGNHQYPLSLPFGEITKITAHGGVAAWTDTKDAEILSVNEESVLVQGSGDTTVFVAKNGLVSEHQIRIGKSPSREISI